MKKNNQKSEIRKNISRKRRYLTKTNKKSFDETIIQTLTELTLWKNALTILIYISHESEIETQDLIKRYLANKKIVVPKTHLRPSALSLHQIKSFKDLHKGRHDLLEPITGTLIISPNEIDLAIIPGIAFDLNGHRVGYGKGYFDKLNKHLKCKKIALAYSFQIIDNIPAEKHDVKMDFIITEKKKHVIKNH